MKTMRHAVAGLVLFSILVGLLINVYTGLETEYGITKNDTKTLNVSGTVTTGNIVDQFNSLNLIEGVSEVQTGIQSLSPGTGTQFDVLGGLASVGVGVLRTVSGLVTAPLEIVNIIGAFYVNETASIMLTSFVMMIIVYVGFILLSAYLGKDV